MKFNPSTAILDLNGEAIKTKQDSDLVMSEVCCNALLAEIQGEQATGEEKLKKFLLAKRIHVATDQIDVTVEEAALLKRLIGKLYGALVSGQAWQILEGPTGD